MDCPDLGVCNPSVIQPNVRRQATFLNRDTESVVALTPNIKLELLQTVSTQIRKATTPKHINLTIALGMSTPWPPLHVKLASSYTVSMINARP